LSAALVDFFCVKMSQDHLKMMELEKERQKLQLRKLQADAGLISRREMVLTIERMDWMYECPLQAQKEIEQEEYLLGKPLTSVGGSDNSAKRIDDVPGSLYLTSITKTTEDTLRKLREDPMLIIRQAEHKQRKAIMANPLLREKFLVMQKQSDTDRNENVNVVSTIRRDKDPSIGKEVPVPDRPTPPRHSVPSRTSHGSSDRKQRSRVSDEERAERIRQMQSDGIRHERRKDERLKYVEAKERRQEADEEEWRKRKKGFSLTHKLNKEAYDRGVESRRSSYRRRTDFD